MKRRLILLGPKVGGEELLSRLLPEAQLRTLEHRDLVESALKRVPGLIILSGNERGALGLVKEIRELSLLKDVALVLTVKAPATPMVVESMFSEKAPDLYIKSPMTEESFTLNLLPILSKKNKVEVKPPRTIKVEQPSANLKGAGLTGQGEDVANIVADVEFQRDQLIQTIEETRSALDDANGEKTAFMAEVAHLKERSESLEVSLSALRVSHANELEVLKSTQLEAIEEMRDQLRADSESSLSALAATQLESEEALRAAHVEELGAQRVEYEVSINEMTQLIAQLEEQHSEALESTQSKHDESASSNLESHITAHEEAMSELVRVHSEALESIRVEHAEAIDTIRNEMSSDRESALSELAIAYSESENTLRTSHKSELERQQAEFEIQSEELIQSMLELEEQHAAALEATQAEVAASSVVSLDAERTAHEEVVSSLMRSHSEAIDSLQGEQILAMEALRNELSSDSELALSELSLAHSESESLVRASHASELERQQVDFEVQAQELMQSMLELEERHAAALEATQTEVAASAGASLDAERTAHEEALLALQASHSEELDAFRSEQMDTVEALRLEHQAERESALSELSREHSESEDSIRASHASELERQQAEFEVQAQELMKSVLELEGSQQEAIDEAKASFADESLKAIEHARAEHSVELASLIERHGEVLEELRVEREIEINELKSSHSTQLRDSSAENAELLESKLGELRESYSAELDALKVASELARGEDSSKQQAELDSLTSAHASEMESQRILANQNLAEVEAQIATLQENLDEKTRESRLELERLNKDNESLQAQHLERVRELEASASNSIVDLKEGHTAALSAARSEAAESVRLLEERIEALGGENAELEANSNKLARDHAAAIERESELKAEIAEQVDRQESANTALRAEIESLRNQGKKSQDAADASISNLRNDLKEKSDALDRLGVEFEDLIVERDLKLSELEEQHKVQQSKLEGRYDSLLEVEKGRAVEAGDRVEALQSEFDKLLSDTSDLTAKYEADRIEIESQREQLADELAAQSRLTEIAESDAMAAREHADMRVGEIESANRSIEQLRGRLEGVEEELASTFSSLTHQATDMVNLEIGIQEAEAKSAALEKELSEAKSRSDDLMSEALEKAAAEKKSALGESIALSRGFIQEQREHLKLSETQWAQAEDLYGTVVKELMDLLERAPDQSEHVYGVLGQLQEILEANRVIVEGNRSIVREEEVRLTSLMRRLS